MVGEPIDVVLPYELMADLRRMAAEEDKTLNALVREAVEAKVRGFLKIELIRDWEAENGPITAEERDAARRVIVAAEARYLGLIVDEPAGGSAGVEAGEVFGREVEIGGAG